MPKRENEYQRKLIKTLESRFPGCFVMKNDEQYRPGTPDLAVLHHDKWAMLEVKRSEEERKKPGPNQEHYVDTLRKMGGFAAFIYPSIEEEVLDALQRSFETGR